MLCLALALWACDDDNSGVLPSIDATPDAAASDAQVEASKTAVRMDFTLSDGFFAAPFPDVSRRPPGRPPQLAGLPNPAAVPLIETLRAELMATANGWSVSGAIFFSLTDALDPASLPDVSASVTDDASAFVLPLTVEGPRTPIRARYEADGGPLGAPHFVSLLPYQGFPLAEGTLYAAVLTTALRGADGLPLPCSPVVAEIYDGQSVSGLDDTAWSTWRQALIRLAERGVPPERIAGLAVFSTGAPTHQMTDARADALEAMPAPAAPPELTEVQDDFCVYTGTIEMPTWQQGAPPFATEGGAWAWEDGHLVLQGHEEANLVLTVPRHPMPEAGYPLVVFSRTGGGGDRPLVDRGFRPAHDAPPEEPGSGPARHFARAGFAGLSIDGPHGGRRNITGGDEQFLIFNINNPAALRDNIRQSALELVLAAHLIDALTVDLSTCPGAEGPALRFDHDHLALMGHSMGATIAPLAFAVEPRFGALLLSGAGGSWLENVVHKISPIATAPLAQGLLRYGLRELHSNDIALTLLQWAGEAADPPLYGAAARDRHVLMMQGIVDTYILPPMANTESLALGLDLAGPALDATEPRLAAFEGLESLLPLAGHAALAWPVRGNGERGATRVVTQNRQGPVEDGHEVVFQTPGPKAQYEHFLSTWLTGTPEVPAP
ncbi:MAG: hypothetical protein KC620_13815 [Myxococcales bacterium]|nr:hypothetical protein [Myxococcales bacterium]